MLRILLAGLLLGLLAGTAGAESTDALLERMRETYGGNGPPPALRQRGTTESLLRGNGPVDRAYRHPDHFRIEIRYPSQTELRVLAGEQAWQQGRPAAPAFRAALKLQAARFALPWLLLERRPALVDGGTIVVGETTLRLLELPLAEDLRLSAEVDPASGRILRSRGQYTKDGQVMEFATAYEDFASYNGRLFARSERHYAMGRYIGRTQLEHIEILESLPANLFEPTAP